MQRLLLIFALLSTGVVQSGCQSKGRNSLLIIAIDDLASTDVTCSNQTNSESGSDNHSGFDLLCKESVRFTHAFSPSTMAVPALSSVLTGTYPFQNGVRNNAQSLRADAETAAEFAVRQKYRTAFFSGGAPVLRKSGINQGFEIFDDNIAPDLNLLFRPFSKSAENFKTWLRQEVGSSSFFAMIYLPDLIFTNTVTISDLGEPRNLTYESQLDELNSSLATLFQYLKKIHRWDNTTIILTGLNGRSKSERPQGAALLNLHSESTQVALLIKPAQKARDSGITWKIDKNISLADLGPTLFEMLQRPAPPESPRDFPLQSLVPFLRDSEDSTPEDRLILTESGWGAWRGHSGIRNAVIKNHVLFINDEKVHIYNTLVDRFEITPLPSSDSYTFSPYSVLEALRRNQLAPWSGAPPSVMEKLNLDFSSWLKPPPNPSLLRELREFSRRFPEDEDFANWSGAIALENKDWATLKEIGTKFKKPLWTAAADKNLGFSKIKITDPCFTLLKDPSLNSGVLKTCNDPLMLDLVDWLRSDVRGLMKEFQRKKFVRAYRLYQIDRYVRRNNIAVGMIWDTDQNLPFAPTIVDIVLSLPEYQKVHAQLDKWLRTYSVADE